MAAMLASQMAATHSLAMDMLGRARRAEMLEHMQAHGALATKLLRTFTAQTEALAKIKRGGEQTVRVEHVHVYQGGQAIVGAVSNRKVEGGGDDEKGNQARGTDDPRAFTVAPGAALLGPNAIRDALPEACGERQKALPAPRRGGR
jgi:hypothetical protein